MEKLELKHLTGYLPYGLKVQLLDRKKFTKRIVVGCTNKGILRIGDDGHHNWEAYFDKIKPILRPMSDLIKEINVNGVKIIPIIEIAKISESVIKVIRINSKKTITGFDYENGLQDKMRFCLHHLTNHFQITFIDNEEYRNDCVLNQLEMFDKLFEWHFDVHDLLSKGLAIDKNTLP